VGERKFPELDIIDLTILPGNNSLPENAMRLARNNNIMTVVKSEHRVAFFCRWLLSREKELWIN